MTFLKEKCLETVIVMLALLFGFSFNQFALGIINPATTYCQDLGYEWAIEKTAEGEIGICKFPDGSTVGDWDFLKGKKGQEWSYCKKKGYELKTISDINKCASIFSGDCAVCVLKEGVEIETLKLLGFEVQLKSCGNKICNSGENLQNCPQDCLYKKRSFLPYTGILFAVILIGIFIYSIKKRREKEVIKPIPKV